MLYFESFSQHTFHCPLSHAWTWVKTVTKFSELISFLNKKISIEPLVISIDKTFELHSKFRCFYQDRLSLDFTVESIIETDYYNQVRWRIDLPNHIETTFKTFTLTISLHYSSANFTAFTAQIDFSDDDKAKVATTAKRATHEYYQLIAKCLENKAIPAFNSESRLIKAPLSECVHYFENARICTGLVGRVVSLTDDEIKKGTIVINSTKEWGSGKDEQLVMQVRQCLNKRSTFKSSFFIYQKNKASPLRSMETQLYQVNGQETLALLKHHFFTSISEQEYNLISSGKKRFLKQIGHIIETLNKNPTENEKV